MCEARGISDGTGRLTSDISGPLSIDIDRELLHNPCHEYAKEGDDVARSLSRDKPTSQVYFTSISSDCEFENDTVPGQTGFILGGGHAPGMKGGLSKHRVTGTGGKQSKQKNDSHRPISTRAKTATQTSVCQNCGSANHVVIDGKLYCPEKKAHEILRELGKAEVKHQHIPSLSQLGRIVAEQQANTVYSKEGFYQIGTHRVAPPNSDRKSIGVEQATTLLMRSWKTLQDFNADPNLIHRGSLRAFLQQITKLNPALRKADIPEQYNVDTGCVYVIHHIPSAHTYVGCTTHALKKRLVEHFKIVNGKFSHTSMNQFFTIHPIIREYYAYPMCWTNPETLAAAETQFCEALSATINKNKLPVGFSKTKAPPDQRTPPGEEFIIPRTLNLNTHYGKIAKHMLDNPDTIHSPDYQDIKTLLKTRYYLLNSAELHQHKNREMVHIAVYSRFKIVHDLMTKAAIRLTADHPVLQHEFVKKALLPLPLTRLPKLKPFGEQSIVQHLCQRLRGSRAGRRLCL